MKINSLTIENYRKFDSIKLDLSEGINVIIGPNEAGKSTISGALLDVLFTDPGTRAKQFTDRVLPWKGNTQTRLVLDFEHAATLYRLEKDFGKHLATLTNTDTKKSIEGNSLVAKALEKVTGIGSPLLYTSTAFIRQSEIASIETDSDFISAVQNAAGSGGHQNIVQLVEEIKEQIRTLKTGLERPANNPGPIKLAQDQINEITAELNEKRPLWEQGKHAGTTARTEQSKLSELEEKVVHLEQLISNHKQNEELSRKLTEITTQVNKIEEQVREYDRLADKQKELQHELVRYAYMDKIDSDKLARELTSLSEAVNLTKNEIANIEKPAKPEPQKQLNKFLFPGIAVLAGLAISLVASNFLFLIFAAALAALIYYVQSKPVASNYDQEMMRVEQISKQLQQKLKGYEHNYHSLTSKFKIANIDDFYTQKARYTALKAALGEVQGQIKGIIGSKGIEVLKKEQLELFSAKKEIEVNGLTEEVKNSKLSPDEYLRKRRELDLLYLEKKRTEQSAAESKVRAEDAAVEIEQLNLLEEKLAIAENNFRFYKAKEKTLNYVGEALLEAVAGTAKSSGELVGKEIEQHLSTITAAKYSDARLTNKLEIEVFSSEKNAWIKPTASLSRGTVDLVYFLARIAFVKTVLGKHRIPLLLDDPFVTFDKKRREQVKVILEKLAEEYQIILLTHSDDYKGWGRSFELS